MGVLGSVGVLGVDGSTGTVGCVVPVSEEPVSVAGGVLSVGGTTTSVDGALGSTGATSSAEINPALDSARADTVNSVSNCFLVMIRFLFYFLILMYSDALGSVVMT